MLRMNLLTLGILKTSFRLLQWSLHPLRFPRYRGTETLNRNFILRMKLLTLGILKTSFRLLQWSLHPLRFPRYRGTETLNRNFEN